MKYIRKERRKTRKDREKPGSGKRDKSKK